MFTLDLPATGLNSKEFQVPGRKLCSFRMAVIKTGQRNTSIPEKPKVTPLTIVQPVWDLIKQHL